MDLKFNSAKELYDRVKPALNSKVKELKINNIDYIKVEDIWNYLITNIWTKQSGLELSDIVDDILNVPNEDIEKFVQAKMEKMKRKVELETLDI